MKALPKYLISPHPYRIMGGGILEDYCIILWCMSKEGMGKT
jgi:hypothetical protein